MLRRTNPLGGAGSVRDHHRGTKAERHNHAESNKQPNPDAERRREDIGGINGLEPQEVGVEAREDNEHDDQANNDGDGRNQNATASIGVFGGRVCGTTPGRRCEAHLHTLRPYRLTIRQDELMDAEEPLMHPLTTAVLELETHVHADGWDQPVRLFALAYMSELIEREPDLAAAMELDATNASGNELIPVEQEWSAGTEQIDEALAQIAWPPQVVGTAIVVERILLPPSAEAELEGEKEMAELIEAAVGHPDRREVRLAAAVLRDGRRMCAIRLRDKDNDDDVLTGIDLLPGLTDALALTLE